MVKIRAVLTSEMLVYYRNTTQRHDPEELDFNLLYRMITNDVSDDYINIPVRIAHIICNHPLLDYEYRGRIQSLTSH
jgi:hypothetical protein